MSYRLYGKGIYGRKISMKYIKPEMETIVFGMVDVLTVSGGSDSDGSNEKDYSDLDGMEW